MPAGITHLRFGQNKPKPGRKNQATGNTYRPCPSIRVPLRTGFLSLWTQARAGETQSPLHFGIALDYGSEIKSSCLGMVQAGASLHSGSDGFAGIRPQVGAVEPDGDWPQQRHSFAWLLRSSLATSSQTLCFPWPRGTLDSFRKLSSYRLFRAVELRVLADRASKRASCWNQRKHSEPPRQGQEVLSGC